MTPEAQRLAIAEACGWVRGSWAEYASTGLTDNKVKSGRVWTQNGWSNSNTGEARDELPDYLNDLNAMNEAEETLDVNVESPNSPRYEYSRILYGMVPDKQQPFRATAAQRAEAFLRTIGKWRDNDDT